MMEKVKKKKKETVILCVIRRWVDNIKMDLREIGGMVWIGLIGHMIGTSGVLL
jgi:hypothetical protein